MALETLKIIELVLESYANKLCPLNWERPELSNPLKRMVGDEGFEPPTLSV